MLRADDELSISLGLRVSRRETHGEADGRVDAGQRRVSGRAAAPRDASPRHQPVERAGLLRPPQSAPPRDPCRRDRLPGARRAGTTRSGRGVALRGSRVSGAPRHPGLAARRARGREHRRRRGLRPGRPRHLRAREPRHGLPHVGSRGSPALEEQGPARPAGHHGAGAGVDGAPQGDGQARPDPGRVRARLCLSAHLSARSAGGRARARQAPRLPGGGETPLLREGARIVPRDGPGEAGGDRPPGPAHIRDADAPGVDSGRARPAGERRGHPGPGGPRHHRPRAPARADGPEIVRLAALRPGVLHGDAGGRRRDPAAAGARVRRPRPRAGEDRSPRRRRQAHGDQLPTRLPDLVRDLGGPARSAPVRPDSSRSRGRCAAPSRRSGRLPEPHRGHGIPRRPTPGLGAPTRGARASRSRPQEPSSSPRALLREYREPYRSPRRHFDWYFRALADDPLAALSWYASHLFGARRTHRLETLARIFQRDS